MDAVFQKQSMRFTQRKSYNTIYDSTKNNIPALYR